MSLLISGVTPTEITQGVTRENVLIVNQSSDEIMVGDRDTLQSQGMTLESLASLSVLDIKPWYAQSKNPNGSSVDFLFSAAGWSPSPGQIAAQISESTLSTAIAQAMFNQGSRLVDNTSAAIVTSLNPFPVNWYGMGTDGSFNLNSIPLIDVRNYQSYILAFYSDVQTSLTLYWFDESKNILISRTYELKPSVYTTITDNHIGPYIGIVIQNMSPGAGFGAGIQWRMSNRVFPGETVEPNQDAGYQDDGNLLVQASTAVAAGASSALFIVPPIRPGTYQFHVFSAFSGQLQYWNSQQQASGNHRIFNLPANGNSIFEIAGLRRALYFQLSNTSASAGNFAFYVMWKRA